MADSWWEPCPPADRTRQRPSGSQAVTTRTRWTSPSGFRRRSSPASARTRGRSRAPSGTPAMRRRAGRAKSSKLTIDDTGLPGRPNTGTPPTSPKAKGLAGRTATWNHRMSPMRSSTTFTRSTSPMLTPPLVSTASHRSTAERTAPVMAASSSPPRPRSTGTNPDDASSASSVGRLESRTCPGSSGAPPPTSSSPVDNTPTRGRRWTATDDAPTLARTPRRPGVRTVPGVTTTSPARRSSPARRTAVPGSTGTSTTTDAPSADGAVRSTMTTASAPGGTTAPVMMRTAWPAPTSTGTTGPASWVPTTCKVAGAAATSADRTANPSMAELSKPGTASGARTSAAATAPSASASGTSTTGPGGQAASTKARTSSTGTNVMDAPRFGWCRRDAWRSIVWWAGPRARSRRRLQPSGGDELLEVGAELGAHVVPGQRQLHRGPQVVHLLADVVAALGEDVPVPRLLGQPQGDGVGQLDLAALARLRPRQRLEDAGHEHVAAHHRHVGGRLLGRRLLHDGVDGHQPVGTGRDPAGVGAAVGAHLVEGHLSQRHDGRRPLGGGGHHPAEEGGVVHHHVVAEEDGERLVAHVGRRHGDGVAEAQRLALADVVHLGQEGEVPHLFEQRRLAGALELALQLGGAVEVVLDGPLAASGDHQHVRDPGHHRLFDDVLDGGDVDEGQHLLGHRFGHRQEARAEPGGGDDGLADGPGGGRGGVGHGGSLPRVRAALRTGSIGSRANGVPSGGGPMPTYEYACRNCGSHLEVVQSFSDDPLTECPHCAGSLRKVFGSIGITFKGSSFYKTDSRSGSAASRSSGDGAKESKESTGDGAKETKKEPAKAEPAKAASSPSSSSSSSGSDSSSGTAKSA